MSSSRCRRSDSPVAERSVRSERVRRDGFNQRHKGVEALQGVSCETAAPHQVTRECHERQAERGHCGQAVDRSRTGPDPRRQLQRSALREGGPGRRQGSGDRAEEAAESGEEAGKSAGPTAHAQCPCASGKPRATSSHAAPTTTVVGTNPGCHPAAAKRRAKLSRSVAFTSDTAQNVNPDCSQRSR